MMIISYVGQKLLGCTSEDVEKWDTQPVKMKAPPNIDPAYTTRDTENSIIMTRLVNSMEEDISSNLNVLFNNTRAVGKCEPNVL